MRKIAFFDIDGTLIGFDGKQHVMPDSTKIALKKFRENGNLAFICSGRPMRFISQEFEESMFDGYITLNGTYIVYDGKCIYNKLIDKDTVSKLMSSFGKLKIRCSFAGSQQGYSFNMNKEEIEKYNSFFEGEPKYLIEDWKTEEVQANALDIFFNDVTHFKKCKEYFEESLVFNTHGPHMSADVSFKNWDKSDGIKYITEFLNLEIKNTIAFGDGYNDISMFKAVNTGIAMGNSVDELKKIANYVTDNIFDNGIYNAMVRYELI